MMTAEKLDEADALQGQYGKSESINQSIYLSLSAQKRFRKKVVKKYRIRQVFWHQNDFNVSSPMATRAI